MLGVDPAQKVGPEFAYRVRGPGAIGGVAVPVNENWTASLLGWQPLFVTVKLTDEFAAMEAGTVDIEKHEEPEVVAAIVMLPVNPFRPAAVSETAAVPPEDSQMLAGPAGVRLRVKSCP